MADHSDLSNVIIPIALGVDIGGTNTVFGLIDRNGKCFAKNTISTGAFSDPELLVKAIKAEFDQMTDDTQAFVLKGIGVGAPNGNYYNGTIEYAPNLKWDGVINLVDLFQKHFNAPVFVTNDANAATIGEMTYGVAQNVDDFLMVTLGTGVGSGFVSNGKLIYGHDGFAGELGHVIIEPEGRLCGCTRKGCLETYTSATGVVRTAHEMLENTDLESGLRSVNNEQISSKMIGEMAEKGDPLALKIFDYTAQKLAFGLANAVAITSPKMIVLFGGLANAGDLLLNPLNKYFEEYLLVIYKNKINIVISGLESNNSAILGASAMVWNELKSSTS